MRVLLVDDHVCVRESLRVLLESYCPDEVEVLEASDGLEALAVAAKVSVDLVVTDAHMPRVDGVELARRLKAAWPALPVVALTADWEDDGRARLIAAGVAEVLEKGRCSAQQICDAVTRHKRA